MRRLSGAAIRAYRALIMLRLEKHRRYPRGAERRGSNGRVLLLITVRSDGEAVNAEVAEITGHESFRKSALQALRRVGQLPTFPEAIRHRELLVEFPLIYSIQDR